MLILGIPYSISDGYHQKPQVVGYQLSYYLGLLVLIIPKIATMILYLGIAFILSGYTLLNTKTLFQLLEPTITDMSVSLPQ